MKLNLKVLGLALVAMLAMSAVAASAASASQDEIVVHNGDDAFLTAEALETQIFTVGPTNVPLECDIVEIGADTTVEDGDTKITAEPFYDDCTTPLGGAEVDTNGCHYEFTGNTDGNGHSEVTIQCPDDPIQITAPLSCTISVDSQEVNGIAFENMTNGGTTNDDDVVLVPTIQNDINYTSTGACQFIGIPATGSDGDYIGDVTVKGFDDEDGTKGDQTGISVETE